MFENFGEMDSYEEINELASNLLKEGDVGSLKAMAAENGIPEDYVEMFINGDIPCLTSGLTAAVGKLDKESSELEIKGLMVDWVEYIKGLCCYEADMVIAVRKKGKSLKGCIAQLLKISFENQWPVDKEIIKAAGVKAGKVTFGVPGMGESRKIIREYYLGGAAE